MAARSEPVANALRSVTESYHIPALVTYKAKGVIPDKHAWFGGVLTNGALERGVLEQADLFVAVGLDPVELLPRPWNFQQPVLSLNGWRLRQDHIPVTEDLVGNVPDTLHQIGQIVGRASEWTTSVLNRFLAQQREAMCPSIPTTDLLPQHVIAVVADQYERTRVTVDAGAHMFPVMSLWPAHAPHSMLISNGLSTMGFAVPAAIGAALLNPSEPIVAFTGDGGLLMCLGELCTAAREAVRLRIIVFDDGALSLIKVKQLQRGYATDGVHFGPVDWVSIGRGFGILSAQVRTIQQLRGCLADTQDHKGPVLIAVRIEGAEYERTIRELRG
jgi:acetolactate synthase-1/2/3 large subunit